MAVVRIDAGSSLQSGPHLDQDLEIHAGFDVTYDTDQIAEGGAGPELDSLPVPIAVQSSGDTIVASDVSEVEIGHPAAIDLTLRAEVSLPGIASQLPMPLGDVLVANATSRLELVATEPGRIETVIAGDPIVLTSLTVPNAQGTDSVTVTVNVQLIHTAVVSPGRTDNSFVVQQSIEAGIRFHVSEGPARGQDSVTAMVRAGANPENSHTATSANQGDRREHPSQHVVAIGTPDESAAEPAKPAPLPADQRQGPMAAASPASDRARGDHQSPADGQLTVADGQPADPMATEPTLPSHVAAPADSAATSTPAGKANVLSAPSDEVGMLDSLPADFETVERALDELLAEIDDLGSSLNAWLAESRVSPWLVVAAVGAAGSEVHRRRRRTTAASDTPRGTRPDAGRWFPKWRGLPGGDP